MPVADLLSRLRGPWEAATQHPFLAGVRDGTLARSAFDTWLAQDARFAADLLWFQARLLARSPRPAQAVLARGAVAVVDELGWFEQQAAARGLPPAPAPLPATEAYAALLRRMDTAPPGPALAALWMVERVYLAAWTGAAGGSGEGGGVYGEFVAHWTTPAFAAYVADLERAADAVLAPGGPDDAAAGLVGEVLAAEAAFWQMALGRS